jgi:DNA-binding GntR family transcriptional regulator
MILQDIPPALILRDQSFDYVRGLVAGVLLERAEDEASERHQLTQRDIANITGTSWEMVHVSLKSLQNEGAIRIERHRLIINRELLQKIAVGNAK